MSYHTGRISPRPSDPAQLNTHRPSNFSAKGQKPSSLSRAVQTLLSTPQSARSAGTGFGGTDKPLRRGSRSPVEPLVSSPLRISSSVMASAPSSPERPKSDPDHTPRRSSDQFDRKEVHLLSTEPVMDKDDDAKSEVSIEQAGLKRHSRDKIQGKRGMAAMMSGLESRLFPRSFSRGRESSGSSARRGSSLDSRPPSSSQPGRPTSPSHRLQQSGPKPTFSNTEKGKTLKMDDSHNQSDEVLSKPSGRLPDYVKPTDQEEAGVRLAKDVFDRDKNMIESSDEDSDKSFSEDDNVGLGQWRGRKKKDLDISSITPSDFIKPKENKTPPPDDKKPSKNVSFQEKDKKPRKSALKSVIHPQTSFDIPTPHSQSAAGTPYGSEDEAEKEDVHKAQQLSIFMSTIDNRVPNRSIRTIVRENFASMQEEADGGRRRQRKYLVALDLSDESVYALEWTIGAVLRNGDTLYAIYAMHEDGITSSVQVGEGAKAMKDANAVVGSQTKEVSQGHNVASRNILGRLGPVTTSKSSSADSRASPVAEAERVRAAESISKTCIHLLRKTLLQVRIAVEVIHCKSPKLMVTEAVRSTVP
ncbi:hypothetical protein N7476_010090 [Penicillium atrosanguineum]|uniref:UspA domain-containing protein n=1 Tax=Penicillium atrosanguineum TaxID=1132637 RepID=A0A9W9PPI5_9EURO|nr:hypothetical protein N7476_010090 [Penicillium atrosanguineum]